jgi:hypothetical protein
MNYKKFNFAEAVKFLSELYNNKNNIKLNVKEININKYYRILERVSQIYSNNLKFDKLNNFELISFLNKRNISEESIKIFNLGFARNAWALILKEFHDKPNEIEMLLELGILIKKNNNIYDRFRNRVIFPIKNKFGGIIDAYTILQAVEDGAIVPIVYEGRHAIQNVNQKAIDKGFDYVSEPLEEWEKADLKKKFSKANLIGKTEQRIDEIARDISEHFYKNWGSDKTGDKSGFKGMVVTPDKDSAVKYKKAFDLIGKVTSEVIFSAPDDRSGNENAHDEPTDEVVAFYKKI